MVESGSGHDDVNRKNPDGPIRPTNVRPVPLSGLASKLDLRLDGPDVDVSGATLRAQEAGPGYLFAALPGDRTHGANYASQALAAGAGAVLTDEAGLTTIRGDRALDGLSVLVSDNPRAVLGQVSSQIYGDPSSRLTLIGITGTSGKTTTAYLTEAALRAAGRTVGLVGTVEIRVDGTVVPSSLTTPEAPDLQRLFAVMAERGVDTVVMEVSSHALSLGRVDGTDFAVGGFTNLSQDHLDYHHTMDEYFDAKARLFASGSPVRAHRSVICVDDDWGMRMAEVASADAEPATTVSTSRGSTSRVSTSRGSTSGATTWSVLGPVSADAGSQTVRIATPDGRELEMTVPLPGAYNVANALLAVALATAAGADTGVAIAGLAQVAVPGRLEKVDRGQDFLAVVDYAHKPAAVEAVLATLRGHEGAGRLAVVLGAGGDRDTEKRPLMGAAAARGADLVIVTDDNPRSEQPAAIRAAVVAGAREVDPATAAEIREIGDRRTAIAAAVDWAQPGDIVLVAGKGHETGQEINGVKHPFDDRLVVGELIEAREQRTLRVLVADPKAGIDEARRLVRELVGLAADTGVGSAHRGGESAHRTWAILGEFADLDGRDENVRCIDHDALGRQLVRLAVDKVMAVGDTTRVVRALHQGAVMEGSWGDEAILVADSDAAVSHLRTDPLDAPASGDIVLLSGGELGDKLLDYWRSEASLNVEVVTR
ncbi:UDP-N-acetylmuramoyl-L-alanyl-D-glutamate--2,6-diaminopimelate ligase [Gordonia sp. (in: high G+C Gram-positive bacteria)]|uniref:UDP-N-acetylmuramoyl-L-alanyl-D-glutamate--2, 6-diaminopimelate ligase n=1 Tax=Gordonia sp. (in: high G+C Gram-positive bacteria) TaxID=84139 RepID=UPI003C7762CB